MASAANGSVGEKTLNRCPGGITRCCNPDINGQEQTAATMMEEIIAIRLRMCSRPKFELAGGQKQSEAPLLPSRVEQFVSRHFHRVVAQKRMFSAG